MSLYQTSILQWLQGAAEAPLPDPRWSLYEEAYTGRITAALSSTLLERVSYLFGEGFVQSLIADFIQAHPPEHPIMPELLRAFPYWLKQKGWEATHPELVALVDLALQRWDVLVGEDPIPGQDRPGTGAEMEALRLQPNHALCLSQLPIFDLWRAGDPDQTYRGDRQIAAEAQGIVFYKSSPLVLESLCIPEELFGLMRKLSQGLCLSDALEGLDDSPALRELLARMIHTEGPLLVSASRRRVMPEALLADCGLSPSLISQEQTIVEFEE